jgi:hypothetical protein
MSTFNQGVSSVPVILNSSNVLVFGNTSSGNALSVQQLGAGNVVSFSNASGNVGLVVSSTSNVGIGTTNPLYPLEIRTDPGGVNPTDNVLRLFSVAYATGTSNTAMRIEKGNGYGGVVSGYINQGVGSGLRLSTLNGGTQVDNMTLTNVGNVGIGNTGPLFAVDLTTGLSTASAPYVAAGYLVSQASNLFCNATSYGGGGTYTGIKLTQGDFGSKALLLLAGGAYATTNAIIQAKDIKSDRNYGLNLLLNPDGGNVGIGTVSPSYLLHVNGALASTGRLFTYVNSYAGYTYTFSTTGTYLITYFFGNYQDMNICGTWIVNVANLVYIRTIIGGNPSSYLTVTNNSNMTITFGTSGLPGGYNNANYHCAYQLLL